MRTIAFSSLKRYSASAFDSSVYRPLLFPMKINEPIAAWDLATRLRLLLTASLNARIASPARHPLTYSFSRFIVFFNGRSEAFGIPECPSTWPLLQQCPHCPLLLSEGIFTLASPSFGPELVQSFLGLHDFSIPEFRPPCHNRPLSLRVLLQTSACRCFFFFCECC